MILREMTTVIHQINSNNDQKLKSYKYYNKYNFTKKIKN
jgi:hypothetical protein